MVDDLTVVCPKCHASGHVPLGFVGKDIHCKKCGVHFRVPAAHPAAAPVTPPPPSVAYPQVGASAHARHATATAPTPTPVAPAPDDDGIALAPLTPEEEVHCRERYEARVLSKDRGELKHDPDIERERERAARRGTY